MDYGPLFDLTVPRPRVSITAPKPVAPVELKEEGASPEKTPVAGAAPGGERIPKAQEAGGDNGQGGQEEEEAEEEGEQEEEREDEEAEEDEADSGEKEEPVTPPNKRLRFTGAAASTAGSGSVAPPVTDFTPYSALQKEGVTGDEVSVFEAVVTTDKAVDGRPAAPWSIKVAIFGQKVFLRSRTSPQAPPIPAHTVLFRCPSGGVSSVATVKKADPSFDPEAAACVQLRFTATGLIGYTATPSSPVSVLSFEQAWRQALKAHGDQLTLYPMLNCNIKETRACRTRSSATLVTMAWLAC